MQAEQIACVFDDINDLPMAGICGLRFRVRRRASPLFTEFVDRAELCDYVTGADASNYAVREICELMLGLMDAYSDVVESRVTLDTEYNTYLKARQLVNTDCYRQRDDVIGKS